MDVKVWFPVMLDMKGKRVVVVGGGAVAARKAASLAEAGAEVTVVSPELHRDLLRMVDLGRIKAVRLAYGGIGQLKGAWLAVAAAGDEAVNRAVCRDAQNIGILWNDASDARRSAMLMPRTIRRGGLVIAVSTSGASPGLAKRIAERLEDQFGEAYAEYIDFLAELRTVVLRDVKDAKRRRMIFESALKSGILESIGTDRTKTMEWLLNLPESDGLESNDETTHCGGHKTKRTGADPDESGD